MPVVFVSHASKDDAAANALESWLRANGFTDLFVDHHSIAGGEKWSQALKASAGACRVVICLVTENWLASAECFGEFKAAGYMGRRIIPLFLLPPMPNLDGEARQRLTQVCAEDQGIDLKSCLGSDGVLSLETDQNATNLLARGLRAAGALTDVGLDPEAFEVDRKLRPTPFPGLASFGDSDADAALFYGRSGEIAHTLQELRKMRAERDLRPLVIFGFSGAGKSSLLKAGIIPRLRREAPAWLPLHAFRPGADPLLNFAETLSLTLADFGRHEARGTIRDRLFDVWSEAERGENNDPTVAGLAMLERALEAEGHKLREAAGRSTASILISVDQAEEMARAEGKSGEALADYLRVALAASESNWQLAFTVRTDSFLELQRHQRFQNLEARGYDLRAVPFFRFENVVVQPAKRYGVKIDASLIDALMNDAPKEDALPLLAFALQRLWNQYEDAGALTKDNYDKVGRLNGLIEDAAERALRGLTPEQDVPLPSGAPLTRLIDLGASTFVPGLAQINAQGATIRQVVAWTSFNEEQQELLNRFERWRLVVRKGTEADGGTVEVAHESLFREWTRLRNWLEPERARLDALRLLHNAASTWDRQGRKLAFLDHRDERLADATALSANDRYCKRLSKLEFDYLAACREGERAAKRQRLRAIAGVLLLVIVVALGATGWANREYLKLRFELWADLYWRHMVRSPEQEWAFKPKEEFQECTRCPVMVVVPPGEFNMGSPSTEKGRDPDENPQHKVTIARAYAVSKFEVTFDEWDACVAVGECNNPGDQGWGRGKRPVINVGWEDVQLYVAWLSRQTGKPYRLLSEAEWEYAARAGGDKAYSWGEEVGNGNGNCFGCGSQWDYKQTAPVGSFSASAFGLHDMHGNVWEWVEDCYNENYQEAPVDGSAWISGQCINHVVRGGSWSNEPQYLRAANRNEGSTVSRVNSLGFRVARTLNVPIDR